jgi:hypothetical protein
LPAAAALKRRLEFLCKRWVTPRNVVFLNAFLPASASWVSRKWFTPWRALLFYRFSEVNLQHQHANKVRFSYETAFFSSSIPLAVRK